MPSKDKNTKWTLYLQVATLIVLILTTIFNHYSQKSLIDHKADIEKKEPRIFGTVIHTFLPEKYISNKKVKLTNVLVKDGAKTLGETMYLEDHLVNYPVLLSLQIENSGNLQAENVVIEVTTPAGSLMRGSMKEVKYSYADCKHDEEASNFRISIECQSMKQGETRSFNLLWVPNFFSKDIKNFTLEETFTTTVSSDDFIEANVYLSNGPKGVILKGALQSSLGVEYN